MKKAIVILLFVTGTSFASIPIRDENGCLVGSKAAEAFGYKESTQTTIPWYLVKGKMSLELSTSNYLKCPQFTREVTEIKIPFGRVVGHLVWVFSDIYITVPTRNEVKYFPTRDVFIKSDNEWSFCKQRKLDDYK